MQIDMLARWLLGATALCAAACGDATHLDSKTDASATASGTGGTNGAGGASGGAGGTATRPDSGAGGVAVDAGGSPLPHQELGANVDATGVAFAVWAPHATAASIEGDFGGPSVPMKGDADGVYRAHVATAHAGTRYRFLFSTPAGSVARLDPYGRERDGARSVVVDPGAYAWKSPPFTAATRAATVAYELHVGSFATPVGAAHGTFVTARDKLADLADLGVDVVELMPSTDFGGYLAWGYAPELYHAPKPLYGAPDDLRGLVDEAHARGVGVWLDVVYNHYEGWSGAPLHCYDGPCNGAAGLYFFGPGPYATTPWGPRPDYTAPRVAAHLLDALDTWLVEYRGDGFRWDSVSNIRALDGKGDTPGGKDLLVAGNARTHAHGGLAIAEDLKGYDAITRTPADGGFGFDAQWDGFGYDVADVVVPASDDGRDIGKLQNVLEGGYGGDPFARLLYLETHDTVGNGGARLPVRIDPADPESFAARRRSMIARTLLFTTPGVPMLFMGEEYLTASPFADPPAPLAAPTPRGLEQRAFTRDLIRLRRNLDGRSGGLLEPGVEILHRNDMNKVLAFRRFGPSGEDVIVAVNLRNKSYTRYDVGVADAGTYVVRVNSERKAYGSDFSDGPIGAVDTLPIAKDGRANTLPLVLPAYGAMVLTR